jgi:hypothetical protein
MKMPRTAMLLSGAWMVPRSSLRNARYQPFCFTLHDLTKARSVNPDADEAVSAGSSLNAQTFALTEGSQSVS